MRRMFSEKQIEEMVKKTNLQDVDLKVKTIEQNEANWELEFKAPTISGFNKLNEYAKFIKINQSLKLILVARYLNNDAENAKQFSLGSSTILAVPNEIGSKVFDMSGKSVSENITQGKLNNMIRVSPMGISVYGQNSYIQPIVLEHYSSGNIRILHENSVSVNGDNIVGISLEINLTLV